MKKSKNPGKKTTISILAKTCPIIGKAYIDFNQIQKTSKPEYFALIMEAGIKIVKPVKGE